MKNQQNKRHSKQNPKTEEDYLDQLNSSIDIVMLIAAGEYRKVGPLGKVNYEIMCECIKPDDLDFLHNRIKTICQNFNLSGRDNFRSWYGKMCKKVRSYERSSADAVFDKIFSMEDEECLNKKV